MMANLVSILMSLFVLMQSFQLSVKEMTHLKDLISHIQFHEETYGDDLFTFMAKHYGELQNDHQKRSPLEKNEHKKLPFTHHVQNLDLQMFYFKPFYEIPLDFKDHACKQVFNYVLSSGTIVFNKIFQPPKN